MKILVIDDDELARLTCRNILKKIGHDVAEADNGVRGLQKFREDKPDAVITDMLMPDKEGLETIADIRAIDPRVPIVAMSAGGVKQNMAFLKLAEKVGANRLLAKPFSPDELAGCLRSLGIS